jgi:hypothetical protein
MRKLSGDVNGGMVSVLSSALETDGDPLIRFHMTQIIPAFPIIVYENCKRGFCGGTIWLGYFAPIGTTIFKHTLGSGRCKGASGGCWCGCGLLFNSLLLHWAVDELPLILDGTLKLLLLCRTSHSPHGKFYPLAGGKEVGYIYWL